MRGRNKPKSLLSDVDVEVSATSGPPAEQRLASALSGHASTRATSYPSCWDGQERFSPRQQHHPNLPAGLANITAHGGASRVLRKLFVVMITGRAGLGGASPRGLGTSGDVEGSVCCSRRLMKAERSCGGSLIEPRGHSLALHQHAALLKLRWAAGGGC